MNNLAWQAGKNLKRSVEASGRVVNINHWVVALWMIAEEEGIDLDALVVKLIAAANFAPTPTDRDEIRRQLGY